MISVGDLAFPKRVRPDGVPSRIMLQMTQAFLAMFPRHACDSAAQVWHDAKALSQN
jgi:hypothetical protein